MATPLEGTKDQEWTRLGIATVSAISDEGSDQVVRCVSSGWQKHTPLRPRSSLSQQLDGAFLRARSFDQTGFTGVTQSRSQELWQADGPVSDSEPSPSSLSSASLASPSPGSLSSSQQPTSSHPTGRPSFPPSSPSSSSECLVISVTVPVSPRSASHTVPTATTASKLDTAAQARSTIATSKPSSTVTPTSTAGFTAGNKPTERLRRASAIVRLKNRTQFTATARFDFNGRGKNELSFQRGQRLVIVATTSNKVASCEGWWKARIRGHTHIGWIPSAYVQKDEYAGDRGVALFAYRSLCSDGDDEAEGKQLSMDTGDQLIVLRHNQEPRGWWKVIINGRRGYVPGSHAQLIADSDDEDDDNDYDDDDDDDDHDGGGGDVDVDDDNGGVSDDGGLRRSKSTVGRRRYGHNEVGNNDDGDDDSTTDDQVLGGSGGDKQRRRRSNRPETSISGSGDQRRNSGSRSADDPHSGSGNDSDTSRALLLARSSSSVEPALVVSIPAAAYLRDILQGLHTSERKIGERLKGLVRDYMFPLAMLQDWSTGETLLSEDDMFSIFGNVTQIAASSARVLELTEKAMKQINLIDATTNLLQRMVSVLGPYKSYSANRVMSRVIINKRRTEDFQLAALLELRRGEQAGKAGGDGGVSSGAVGGAGGGGRVGIGRTAGGMTLDQALNLPIKRLDYYAELVNRVRRGIRVQEVQEFAPLIRALAPLEQCIAELREITQRSEEQIQLIELQCSFTRKVPQLTSFLARRFVAKAEYKRVVYRKRDLKYPVAFFFTDCIVFAKKNRRSERTYIWWATVPLAHTVILSREGHGSSPVIAITEGTTPQDPCLLTALHEQQHQLCVALLRNCATACSLSVAIPILTRQEKSSSSASSSSSTSSSLEPYSAASSSSAGSLPSVSSDAESTADRLIRRKSRSRLSVMHRSKGGSHISK